jgi:hypothetical protein
MNAKRLTHAVISTVLTVGCGAGDWEEDGQVAAAEDELNNECTSIQDCRELYPGRNIAACNPTNGACRCFDGSGTKVRCDSLGAGSGGDGYRIAYSADGNQHDHDDLHASPMALALLHRAGMKSKLVHFDYNNHLGDNNGSMASQQRSNINTAISTFGYSSALFFDDQSNLNGAISSLARAVNASSSGNRLMLICAGPMEVCWRGINAADDGKEQFVTVISHSSWNDGHQDTTELNHTWADIRDDFDVLAHHINDQNPPAFNESCNNWTWLKNIAGYGGTLYSLVCERPSQKAGDASDAGMMYYVIRRGPIVSGGSGTSSPSMADIRAFFGQR